MKEVVQTMLTFLTLEMSGGCKTKETVHKYCTLVDKVVFCCCRRHPVVELFMTLCDSKDCSTPGSSVLPMNIQGLFPLGLTGLISLQSKGLSRIFPNTTVQENQFFGTQLSLLVQLSHPYMTTGKTIVLTIWTFANKVMSLFFTHIDWNWIVKVKEWQMVGAIFLTVVGMGGYR